MARLLNARTVVLGGLAVAAAAAGLLKKRGGPAGLLNAGDDAAVPPPAPAPAEASPGTAASEPGPSPAPAVANADAAGPPANTATHVPAPEPLVHPAEGGIDEAAEEAAAAAEAANIGGPAPEYPGMEPGEIADAELAPLIEAGEGEAEGQELAEFELADNAEPSAGDPIEGGRQIDDVIEAQDDPASGEVPADDQSSHGDPSPAAGLTGDAAPAAGLAAAPGPGTPEPQTGDTLAAGTIGDGAPTAGGSLSGVAGAGAADDVAAPPVDVPVSAEAPPPELPSQPSSAETLASAASTPEDAAPVGDPLADPPAEAGSSPAEPPKPEDAPGGDDEWKTWSGRAVEP